MRKLRVTCTWLAYWLQNACLVVAHVQLVRNQCASNAHVHPMRNSCAGSTQLVRMCSSCAGSTQLMRMCISCAGSTQLRSPGGFWYVWTPTPGLELQSGFKPPGGGCSAPSTLESAPAGHAHGLRAACVRSCSAAPHTAHWHAPCIGLGVPWGAHGSPLGGAYIPPGGAGAAARRQERNI